MNPTWVFAVLLITHSAYGTEGEQNQQTSISTPLQANGSIGPIDSSANIGNKVISGPNETLAGNDVSKASVSGTVSGPNLGSSVPVVQRKQTMRYKNNSNPNKYGRSIRGPKAIDRSGQPTGQPGRPKSSKVKPPSRKVQIVNPEADNIQKA